MTSRFPLRAVSLWLLWAALPAVGLAAQLRIATYNVENYTAAARRVEGVYRPEYPKPEAAKAALRAVMRQLDADVWAFQEMGGPPYLAELRRDLRREGLDYPYAEVLSAADHHRHVALLSRRPFVLVRRHTELSFRYFEGRERVRRGLLEARLASASGELTLFVFHLKSRLTERPDDPQAEAWRAGEAMAIRDLILRTFPEPHAARFLLLGDGNDHPASRTVRLLTQRGRTTLATLLPLADSRGEAWTYFFAREHSYHRFDHLFVSAALREHVIDGRGLIGDSAEVRQASDHRPVVVTLREE